MFQNRFQREVEVKDAVIELFRNGSIRSTGENLIEISVDFNSVSLAINRDELEQVIRDVVSTTDTGTIFQDNRMR